MEGQCASSAFDHADGRLPLLEHRIHHCLHLPGGAHAHGGVHRDADQPKRFRVGFKGTRSDPAAAKTRRIVLVQANHPPNGLRDANIIHGTHEQNRF